MARKKKTPDKAVAEPTLAESAPTIAAMVDGTPIAGVLADSPNIMAILGDMAKQEIKPLAVTNSEGVQAVVVPPPAAAAQAESPQKAVVMEYVAPSAGGLLGKARRGGWHIKKFRIASKDKNGLRPFAQATPEYVAALLLGTKPGRRVLQTELALMASLRGDFSKRGKDAAEAFSAGQSTAEEERELLGAYKAWVKKNPWFRKAGNEKIVAQAVAGSADRYRLHAMDVIEISDSVRAPKKLWAPWLASMKKASVHVGPSSLELLSVAGKMLTSIAAVYQNAGIASAVSFGKVEPWRGKQSGNVIGAEITSIVYDLVDADGRVVATVTHETEAKKAWDAASNAGEYEALLARTPAGRAWLIDTPEGGHVAIATDRKARSPIFAVNRKDKFQAKLEGVSGDTVTGLLL